MDVAQRNLLLCIGAAWGIAAGVSPTVDYWSCVLVISGLILAALFFVLREAARTILFNIEMAHVRPDVDAVERLMNQRKLEEAERRRLGSDTVTTLELELP